MPIREPGSLGAWEPRNLGGWEPESLRTWKPGSLGAWETRDCENSATIWPLALGAQAPTLTAWRRGDERKAIS